MWSEAGVCFSFSSTQRFPSSHPPSLNTRTAISGCGVHQNKQNHLFHRVYKKQQPEGYNRTQLRKVTSNSPIRNTAHEWRNSFFRRISFFHTKKQPQFLFAVFGNPVRLQCKKNQVAYAPPGGVPVGPVGSAVVDTAGGRISAPPFPLPSLSAKNIGNFVNILCFILCGKEDLDAMVQ